MIGIKRIEISKIQIYKKQYIYDARILVKPCDDNSNHYKFDIKQQLFIYLINKTNN